MFTFLLLLITLRHSFRVGGPERWNLQCIGHHQGHLMFLESEKLFVCQLRNSASYLASSQNHGHDAHSKIHSFPIDSNMVKECECWLLKSTLTSDRTLHFSFNKVELNECQDHWAQVCEPFRILMCVYGKIPEGSIDTGNAFKHEIEKYLIPSLCWRVEPVLPVTPCHILGFF